MSRGHEREVLLALAAVTAFWGKADVICDRGARVTTRPLRSPDGPRLKRQGCCEEEEKEGHFHNGERARYVGGIRFRPGPPIFPPFLEETFSGTLSLLLTCCKERRENLGLGGAAPCLSKKRIKMRRRAGGGPRLPSSPFWLGPPLAVFSEKRPSSQRGEVKHNEDFLRSSFSMLRKRIRSQMGI